MAYNLPRPLFLLVKAQIVKEADSRFQRMDLDLDFKVYLKRLHDKRMEECKTPEDLDVYLNESLRMSLDEWLDSLTWSHITQ